jgi:hypothetical protein
MAYLNDFNFKVDAQRDERQDNRAWSNSYSIVYNPQVAYPNSKVSSSNTAESKASTDWGQSEENGFTGKNAQTVLIVGVGVVVVAGAAYLYLKK